MKKRVLVLIRGISACTAPVQDSPELAAWKKRAEGVTIIRDDWGVPHIDAKTDADVEFGDRVKATAVTAGGLNSVPGSKHFHDQAERYATDNLRDVYFHREDLKGHTEREYKPGQ